MPLDQISTPDSAPEASTPAGTERRQLLRSAGVGAALLGTLGAGATALTPRRADAAVTDVDILNFALNLEYLEAEFYLMATTGTGLLPSQITGVGTPGPVYGGSKVPFSNPLLRELANDIASDELSHVLFLRKALGSAAVARPTINLTNSFAALAIAAGFASKGQYFSPFASDWCFILGAYTFEDVGVTAYLGAAPSIVGADYLLAAGGILGVEAYHAGAIRNFINDFMGVSNATAAAQISALRSTLSAAGFTDDFGPQNPIGTSNIADTDANAICFSRTPRQVLNVVYGGVNATKGLFFPLGMNGTIK